MAIGVGLIGTGYMGKCHALAWNAVGPVFGVERPRLVALAEVSAERAAARAAEFGFAKSTGDWRELISDPEVDIVSVTTPNAFHAEMAIAALAAGKHVWCEKPMATTLPDAERMAAAARGRVTALGYNYIQNPAIRQMRKLIAEGVIGPITHVRCEMDEDFMADADAAFTLRSEAVSGYGAPDDFGVHALSLLQFLCGGVGRVLAHFAKPYADRPDGAGRRAVETYDVASVLFELRGGASGVMALNRAAWGRKGRIALQIFGAKGSLLYDQERLNEFQLFTADGRVDAQGFRTVLTGPAHPPYDRFIPAPGHGLGFNELKIIECFEVLEAIAGRPSAIVDFERGLEIERGVNAMGESFRSGGWVAVA